MTHEEILAMLGDYVDYLIANSSAEAPMWNIEKVRSGKPNKWKDRKSTRLNSSHKTESRMPSSA